MTLSQSGTLRYAPRQRRPGRQFDFGYWSYFDTRKRNVGAFYRSQIAPDRGHVTPPPPRDPDRRGHGGPSGSDGSGDRRGRIARLLDLLAVGFRYGAPWAWTAHRTPTD